VNIRVVLALSVILIIGLAFALYYGFYYMPGGLSQTITPTSMPSTSSITFTTATSTTTTTLVSYTLTSQTTIASSTTTTPTTIASPTLTTTIQTTTTPVKPSLSEYLKSEISDLMRFYPLDLNESCLLITLFNDTVIYAHNPHKPLIPASNTKLLTAATSLKYLGPDYRFKTDFFIIGKVENNTLKGDLVVRGYGDPTLVSGDWADEWSTKVSYLYEPEHKLDDVLNVLKELGIKKIEGDIIVDDYFLDHQWVHPSWEEEDLSHWYAAQVGALSINRNIVLLELYPKQTGEVEIKVVPDVGYVNVTFAGRLVKSSSEIQQNPIEVRELGTNNVRVVGDLPMDIGVYYLSVTVHDPGMYFGVVFKNMLVRYGIEVLGEVRRANTSEWGNLTFINRLESKPLGVILKTMLKVSLNFYADHLFKVLGRELIGEGSWEGGSKAIQKFLEETKLVEPGVVIADGSGLSRENRLTCSLLVKLLTAYYSNKVLYDSLPIAGWDGTLKNRMLNSLAKGNLRAKTGTMTGVSALSGYVTTRDRKTIVFSMIFNNFKTSASTIKREVEDYIGDLLAELDTTRYRIP